MSAPPEDATRRFSIRVADYVRYRPSYPEGVLDVLHDEAGLIPGHIVADIGSGTGILSDLFLRNGNVVYAVEPNAEMAAAAVSRLGAHPAFHPVSGRAEATGLPPASIDLVAVGQAFHWFDAGRAADEARRILRPGGGAALVWNQRRAPGSPFMQAYEGLLRQWGTDYQAVHDRYADDGGLRAFFGRRGWRKHVLPSDQVLDLEGLRGRLRSSSYTPPPGDPRHQPMLAALEALFAAHERGGQVSVEYDTEIYAGPLGD